MQQHNQQKQNPGEQQAEQTTAQDIAEIDAKPEVAGLPQRSPYSFGLKDLLMTMTLVAIPSAWVGHCLATRQEADSITNELSALSINSRTSDHYLDGPDFLRGTSIESGFHAVKPYVLPDDVVYVYSPYFNEQLTPENLPKIPFERLGDLPRLVLQTCGNLSDKDLEQIGRLEHLRDLQLGHGTMDGSFLKTLRHLGIEDLRFISCDNLKSENLEVLHEFTSLRRLTIVCENLDDAAIDQIVKIKSLEELILYGSDYTAKAISKLSQLESLKSLDLGPSIERRPGAESAVEKLGLEKDDLGIYCF